MNKVKFFAALLMNVSLFFVSQPLFASAGALKIDQANQTKHFGSAGVQMADGAAQPQVANPYKEHLKRLKLSRPGLSKRHQHSLKPRKLQAVTSKKLPILHVSSKPKIVTQKVVVSFPHDTHRYETIVDYNARDPQELPAVAVHQYAFGKPVATTAAIPARLYAALKSERLYCRCNDCNYSVNAKDGGLCDNDPARLIFELDKPTTLYSAVGFPSPATITFSAAQQSTPCKAGKSHCQFKHRAFCWLKNRYAPGTVCTPDPTENLKEARLLALHLGHLSAAERAKLLQRDHYQTDIVPETCTNDGCNNEPTVLVAKNQTDIKAKIEYDRLVGV